MSRQATTTTTALSRPQAQTQPFEDGIEALLHQAEEKVLSSYHDLERCVRQSPTKSLLVAVAAGYVLHRLPLRAIAVAKVRIISALAPPALLLLGAAKLYEFVQHEAAASRTR